ncbi:hypothetical protein NE237_013201 [Protea cynaroides]|uniref:Retrotransposon gag domain-containing protein n=1 Tax=Protea cynaroides TaxID=273540 RepID=A0A9Q0JZY8_9MAGN|nr:hypothetical protein NE237_013201 [Protea cynaroides]
MSVPSSSSNMINRERDGILMELMRGMKEIKEELRFLRESQTTGSNRLKTEETHIVQAPIATRQNIEKKLQDQGRYDSNNQWLDDLDLDVDEFDGRLCPNDFLDWLTKMDDFFDLLEMPENRRVLFAKLKLKGIARVWWNNVEDSLCRKGIPSIINWEEMKLKMKKRFLPPNYKESLFQELFLLRQETKSVEEYASKFEELSYQNHMIEPDWQTLVRFKIGLHPEIQLNMVTFQPHRLIDAVDLALRIEENLNQNSSGSSVIGKRNKNRVQTQASQSDQKEREEHDECLLQRNNPIRTNAYCRGKVLTMVIASGSEGNYVSQCIVNELQLQTEAHPCPYIASCLGNGPEFVVRKRCLVSISLKNFADDILCDIIPMKTAHLILGRPWLYDNDAVCGGRENTCTIDRNGQRFIWRPMKPSGETATTQVSYTIIRKNLTKVETQKSKGKSTPKKEAN